MMRLNRNTKTSLFEVGLVDSIQFGSTFDKKYYAPNPEQASILYFTKDSSVFKKGDIEARLLKTGGKDFLVEVGMVIGGISVGTKSIVSVRKIS
jgi:hypothetical protein